MKGILYSTNKEKETDMYIHPGHYRQRDRSCKTFPLRFCHFPPPPLLARSVSPIMITLTTSMQAPIVSRTFKITYFIEWFYFKAEMSYFTFQKLHHFQYKNGFSWIRDTRRDARMSGLKRDLNNISKRYKYCIPPLFDYFLTDTKKKIKNHLWIFSHKSDTSGFVQGAPTEPRQNSPYSLRWYFMIMWTAVTGLSVHESCSACL